MRIRHDRHRNPWFYDSCHMMIIAIHSSSDPALRVKALKPLLIEKGLVDPGMDEIIDTYSHKIGPQNGAKVVQKLGGPDFRATLFADGHHWRDLGIMDDRANIWSRWKIQPRTTWSSAHYAVVIHGHCWAFRQVGTNRCLCARAVREPPRSCRNLAQPAAAETKIRVWDSTAEIRYLVIPERPWAQKAGQRSNWRTS